MRVVGNGGGWMSFLLEFVSAKQNIILHLERNGRRKPKQIGRISQGHDGSGDITTLPDLALNSPPAAVVDRSSVFGAAA